MPAHGRTKEYRESRLHILRGLTLLFAGCLLLLVDKLPVPELAGIVAVYAGGISLLFGNGCIIFGLLVYAGSKPEQRR